MKTGISYFGNRNPKWVKKDMVDIVEHNCNFVLHTFSEYDRIFYKDTMKEIMHISHKLGLDVYVDPWGVGGVFGGEALSHIISNTDIHQVDSNGNRLPACCINNPGFIEFIHQWIEDAKYIGGDVLFWDEPHFYSVKNGWACRCGYCREEFKRKYGHNMPDDIDDEVVEFRENSIVGFLQKVTGYGKRLGMKSAVCLLPEESSKPNVKDWAKIAGMESVDIIATDPYRYHESDFEERVRTYANRIFRMAKNFGKEGQMWVQCFSIRKGDEWKVKRAVKIIFGEGIRNIGAWSYDGTSYMSYIKCDNPKKVWGKLKEGYRVCT
ncbi:hypothetical protein CH333_01240 [candidate division WOR-3 bacterium JGI_Cruoil_03_44_89]|uniref:DUF4015 domain-containing protein n=1 Tax=candidate division WOR-3 bacterium JGI_Cruoil_03_44_89 TaxID=1973748 RepID=A0A235BYI2_UNCW3|nr:MAG: hypothetical protein CH333_01240 [candidate division WOR-3 bacterium JGI_Cruoil_03_44_89]